MYLIDTSILVDFLKGKENIKTQKFEEILLHNIPFSLSAFTYQEVLQGARDVVEYEKLNAYLSTIDLCSRYSVHLA